MSNFCKTLLGEEAKEVLAAQARFVYREFGNFIFVAHSDLQTGSTVIQAVLRDVGAICQV